MSLADPMSDIVINSVTFGEGVIEVAYMEKREQTENVGIMRNMLIGVRPNKVTNQVNEVVDLLVEVVEAALLNLRNPDRVLDPRQRIRANAAAYTEEDEDDDS